MRHWSVRGAGKNAFASFAFRASPSSTAARRCIGCSCGAPRFRFLTPKKQASWTDSRTPLEARGKTCATCWLKERIAEDKNSTHTRSGAEAREKPGIVRFSLDLCAFVSLRWIHQDKP